MAAHLRHIKFIVSHCRCRRLSTLSAFEFDRVASIAIPIPVGFTRRHDAGSNRLAHNFDPATFWARVDWKEVEGDLNLLRRLSSLLSSSGTSDEEDVLAFLQRLTSPKDLLKIMSDGRPGTVLDDAARAQVEWGLRLLHSHINSQTRTALSRRHSSSVLFSDVLPTRDALLKLPRTFFSDEERRAILLADGPLLDQRVEAAPKDPLESEDEKQKRLGRPSNEQLQVVFDQLASDLPEIFTRPMNYKIYHPNLIFENHIRKVRTEGVVPYIQQVALLRTVGHLKFAYVRFEILKMTKHPEDGTVRIRWRIRGMSGLKVLTTFWRYKIFKYKEMMDKQQELWHDGFSIFHIGGDGLVQKHIATNMMPDDDAERVNKKTGLGGALAALLGLQQLAPERFVTDGVASGILGSSPTRESLAAFSPLPREGDPDPADWTVLMFPLDRIR